MAVVSYEDFQSRANRGAALLDAEFPGWFERIDTDSLDDAREEEFRQHARDNAPPEDSHWSVLHPVCREEWAKRCYGPDKDGKAVYLGLRRSDYQRALDSQSACNLGAIVKALASVVDRIWATERAFKCGGTDWVNTHPIMRLYAEQISHLSGGDFALAQHIHELFPSDWW